MSTTWRLQPRLILGCNRSVLPQQRRDLAPRSQTQEKHQDAGGHQGRELIRQARRVTAIGKWPEQLRKAAEEMLRQAAATAQDLPTHVFSLAQIQYNESFHLGHIFKAYAVSAEEVLDLDLPKTATDARAERNDGDFERLQTNLRGPNGALRPAIVKALSQCSSAKARDVLLEEFEWSDGEDRCILAEALAESDFREVIRNVGTERAERALDLAESCAEEHGQASAPHHGLQGRHPT